MKHLTWICLLLAACTQKKNEAQQYYDTVKEEVHKKTADIQSILKSTDDIPEVDFAESMKTGLTFPADITGVLLNHQVIKSKLYPLAPEDCLIADVEAYRNKAEADYWPAETITQKGINLLLNTNSNYALVLKDSIPNISVQELQHITTPLQQCKYLVVVDCMNYSYPTHVANAYENQFEPGALLKKVTIYAMDTKQVVDSFHLYAMSSKNVKVQYGSAGLKADVIGNLYGLLEAALFKAY
jgi:hypothetical protein